MSHSPEHPELLYQRIAKAKDADQFETKEEYFDLLERIQKLTEDSGEGGVPINNLNQVVQQANDIFKKVLRSHEAKLDAEVLKHVGALGKTVIEKTQTSFVTFSPADFGDKIISFIGEDSNRCLISDQWIGVGTHTESFYKSTQGLIPLYGALEWQRPERIARERQARTQDDVVVMRKTTEEESSSKESKDIDHASRIYNALKVACRENGLKPVLLLRFIIDPDCFSTTIHNMFHLSFLIRDGYAQTSLGDHKLVYVIPVSKNKRDTQTGAENTSQAIIDLDFETFEEAKKLLKIRQPMIPSPKRPHP